MLEVAISIACTPESLVTYTPKDSQESVEIENTVIHLKPKVAKKVADEIYRQLGLTPLDAPSLDSLVGSDPNSVS